jgi:hypothetical protein
VSAGRTHNILPLRIDQGETEMTDLAHALASNYTPDELDRLALHLAAA